MNIAKLFVLFFLIPGCKEGSSKKENFIPPKIHQIKGFVVGDIYNLESIGVQHGANKEKIELTNLEEIEYVFSIQATKKILIVDGPAAPENYGKIFKKNSAQGWITENILKTHDILIVRDIRPRRNGEYMRILFNMLNEVDLGLKDKTFSYSKHYRDGLPVFEIIGSYDIPISEGRKNILEHEQKFQNDLNESAAQQSTYNNMSYLSYVGAAHAYKSWLNGSVKNVYFALDKEQLEQVALTVALEKFIQKNK